MPVLTSLRVTDMLGVWNHVIDFPESWEFVIMYGPNGVGKTKLLEAADALAKLAISKLRKIPFADLELWFSDGTILSASQLPSNSRNSTETAGAAVDQLRIRLTRHGSTLDEVILKDKDGESSGFADWLRNNTSWREFESDLWEDITDGEVLTFEELRMRYQYSPILQSSQDSTGIPEIIREFSRSINTYLIETQRLLTISPNVRNIRTSARRATSSRSTVAEYSEDLKRRLARALAENSRTTQRLDRTFPRRILESPAPSDVDDSTIRVKYQKQNALRTRLASIAVIGGEADLPLPQRPLEDWERHVLWTSLNDTDEKLSSFEEILSRITLLEHIVNRRFLRKKIFVNAEDGLGILAEPDERPLSPESLSSGEQHELILVYGLLFNAPAGTTVLLDEPEISLHVAWQQQFLVDMMQISKLSSLRFIIATHSPQIIHKWWDRTVELGPPSAE